MGRTSVGIHRIDADLRIGHLCPLVLEHHGGAPILHPVAASDWIHPIAYKQTS